VLLDRLPKILAGYGRCQAGADSAVVVLIDLDDRDCVAFKKDLVQIVERCRPRPRVLFRFAIEEIEAWLLGDTKAIHKAFPRARSSVLDEYVQDSICGTWETLADAICSGGSTTLAKAGYPPIGEEKCRWAKLIGPHMDLDSNASPSLRAFRNGLRKLCGTER
jgi:hypothetical protein